MDGWRLEKGANIAELLLRLAASAMRLVDQLPNTAYGRHVGLQWVKAATSACANYEEARGAESRDDFIHKIGISAKEARESVTWKRLIREARWLKEDLDPLIADGERAAAYLLASKRTARKNREASDARRKSARDTRDIMHGNRDV